MKSVKRLSGLLLAIVLAFSLTGCGNKFEPTEDSVRINKSGEVNGVIIEAFDKDYYDSEELKSVIDESISSYNTSAGSEKVSLKKFQVENEVAEVFIDYKSVEDYEEFNEVTFFVGSVVDAVTAGFAFDKEFYEVKDGEILSDHTLPVADITSNPDFKILILEEDIEVVVPGNICYVSSNVELRGKKTAKVLENLSEDSILLSYIIYK